MRTVQLFLLLTLLLASSGFSGSVLGFVTTGTEINHSTTIRAVDGILFVENTNDEGLIYTPHEQRSIFLDYEYLNYSLLTNQELEDSMDEFISEMEDITIGFFDLFQEAFDAAEVLSLIHI